MQIHQCLKDYILIYHERGKYVTWLPLTLAQDLVDNFYGEFASGKGSAKKGKIEFILSFRVQDLADWVWDVEDTAYHNGLANCNCEDI